MTLWLLGTHLDRTADYLDDRDRVLLIEATEFADRRPYHPHKLTLVLAAMRAFRDDLRERGLTVDYRRADTFGEGLDDHFDQHPEDDLTIPRPAADGAEERLPLLDVPPGERGASPGYGPDGADVLPRRRQERGGVGCARGTRRTGSSDGPGRGTLSRPSLSRWRTGDPTAPRDGGSRSGLVRPAAALIARDGWPRYRG